MDSTEAKKRVEVAVDEILRLPAGMAELGLAMSVVGRRNIHWTGRGEALRLFNERIGQLDAEAHGDDAATRARARTDLEGIVLTLEGVGRGEYRMREVHP